MRLVPVTDGSAAAQQLRRSAMDIANSAVLQARSILDDVRSHGDAAVRNYTTKFDGVSLTSLRVSESEISDAYNQVPASQVKAIKLMKDRLARSERVLLEPLKHISVNYSGVSIARKIKPIESVGCYVPGGKARYPSTLVMCAVPARIAGVKRIVAISPPRKDGSIDPLTLVAADICGVSEIYKIGGAQGIAALAMGTETIKPVSKIVGPGGMIVTAAKIAATSHTSTDMVAGPTELLIFADESSDPKLVALDLISQAEHSQDTLVGIVTASEVVAEAVLSEVNSITNSSELARSEYVRKSLEQNGFAAVCKDLSSAIRFINEFAPEHLEIISRKASSIASRIESAGLVLLGANSPSAASDYCLGSNHVLPTLGFAKSRGSLSALDFVKVINFVQVSQTAIASIEQSIKALTDAEGFPNHYNAVKARMDNGRAKKKKNSKKRQ